MPEGDTLHKAARRLQALVGQRLEIESPHPRARAERIPERLSGLRLERVEAVGKNVLFHFEGGFVLRSHLRMSGSWRVVPRGSEHAGRPWLIMRGDDAEAVLRGGPVLELHLRNVRALGPDILAQQPDVDAMLARLRRSDGSRPLGEALQNQRLVAGIGNMWLTETLWSVRLSPWRRLAEVTDEELRAALAAAAKLMRASVETGRRPHEVYRRVGRPCARCRTAIRSRGLGDDNRMAYWCPRCQDG